MIYVYTILLIMHHIEACLVVRLGSMNLNCYRIRRVCLWKIRFLPARKWRDGYAKKVEVTLEMNIHHIYCIFRVVPHVKGLSNILPRNVAPPRSGLEAETSLQRHRLSIRFSLAGQYFPVLFGLIQKHSNILECFCLTK